MTTCYAYIWEYRVSADNDAEFRRHYGPQGAWVRLFRRAGGHIETRLLSDRSVAGRYVTIDRWESERAFRAFRERFSKEFEALDRKCEALTISESPLGSFTEVDAAGDRERLPVG